VRLFESVNQMLLIDHFRLFICHSVSLIVFIVILEWIILSFMCRGMTQLPTAAGLRSAFLPRQNGKWHVDRISRTGVYVHCIVCAHGNLCIT